MTELIIPFIISVNFFDWYNWLVILDLLHQQVVSQAYVVSACSSAFTHWVPEISDAAFFL
jgi:hypothetical protein